MGIPNNIETKNHIIIVAGKVIYNDRRRRITIKKPIRDLFEKGNNDVGYVMELCLSENIAYERIRELLSNNIMPVILYFVEGGDIKEG